jgi:hypothetical protein
MADQTPSYGLSGVLIPREWSTSVAADYRSGTDYTEAERRPGRVTFSGDSPRLALAASGDIDADVTEAIEVKVTTGGIPRPDSAGVVYRYASGAWYGQDPVSAAIEYEPVQAGGVGLQPYWADAVVRPDGTIVAVSVAKLPSSSTGALYVHTRSPGKTGSWTSQTLDTDTGSNYQPASICIAPDGALHIYWAKVESGTSYTIAMYRREASGGSFLLQSTSVAGTTTAALDHLRAVGGPAGVLLFYGDGSSTQYYSSDGGFSFIAAGAAESNAAVLACTFHAGYFVVLTSEDGTAKSYIRRLGNITSDLWGTTAAQLKGTSLPASGGWIAATDQGLYAASADSAGKVDDQWHYSTDAGLTWTPQIGPSSNADTTINARGAAVFVRGRLHVIGVKTTASTGAPASAATSGVGDIIHGGHSTVTMFGRVDGQQGTIGSSVIQRLTPYTTLANSGWSGGSDTGTISRSYSFSTGTQVSADAGEVGQNDFTASPAPSVDTESAAIVRLEVTSGVATMIVQSRPVSVTVLVTSTQIQAYETGSSGSYVSHGISGPMEVRIQVDGLNEDASIWYRDAGTYTDERAWTFLLTISSFTTTSITDAALLLRVGDASAASVVRWESAAFRYGFQPPTSGLGDGVESGGTNLRPVPVLSRRVYLGGGVYVRGVGGPARYDEQTYDIPLGGSRFARANMYPHYQASPRTVYRSSGTSSSPLTTALSFRHTLDQGAGNETRWTEDLVALFLDNMINVPNVALKSSGSTLATIDLRTSVVYSHDDGVVLPAESGSTVSGAFVRAGDLAGARWQFANGKVRRIITNTEGVLTSGSTLAEKRCELTLADIDGTEDTSGTGYIWPRRALVLIYLRGFRTMSRFDVDVPATGGPSAADIGPEGYRQIGTLALGEVMVFGRAFDRNSSNERAANVEIFRAQDGTTTASEQGPIGRTMEVAFVDSPTFLDDIRTGGSPDYVTVSAHANAEPAGTRRAVPATAEGLYQRLGGARLPCVPIRRIPRDDGTGDPIYVATIASGTLADDAFLARLTNVVRREQIQVGESLVSDGERVSTIVFEEIL